MTRHLFSKFTKKEEREGVREREKKKTKETNHELIYLKC